MVPGRTVEIRLERVGERSSWRHGTLLHSRHAVIPWTVLLKDTMPMERGPFLWASDLVVQSHLDGISPICLNHRSWKLAIDQDHTLLISIWSDQATLDSEIVAAYDSGIWGLGVWVAPGGRELPPRESIGQWIISEIEWKVRSLQGSP